MKISSVVYRVCLFFGTISFLIGTSFLIQQYVPRSFFFFLLSAEPEQVDLPQTHQPVELTMNDIGVKLPIFQSHITNGAWEISSLGVSSLSNPEEAGASGGLILYGHNWTSILGKLHQSEIGQPIAITFADGTEKSYVIEKRENVAPSDLSLIENTHDDSLVLYTCTGMFDSRRLVVIASAQ